MANQRLKTPAGQRKAAPGADEKPKRSAPSSSITVADEPAAIVYAAYQKHIIDNSRVPQPQVKKRWHELAVVDRAAWRAACQVLRVLIFGGSHIPLQLPSPGRLSVAYFDGRAYAVGSIPEEDILMESLARNLLEELKARIDKEYEENPEQQRPEKQDPATEPLEDQ